ncbi:MAG TPA: type VI secretion system contractile sheath small subunit, partial [Pyrinomonadaceae bacterium]|nr:type VI secretion system contractile sheath small subunit [Pyrinomonadaceae bacterium]
MSEPFSFGRVELNLVSSLNSRGGRPGAETPFRVLLLGDFSGRAGRGEAVEAEALALRRPVAVDRDNLDDVLRRTAPRVSLSLAHGGPPLDIYFDSLEDFHPDRLYERLEIFRALRQTRRRLGDPATFREAAEEVRRWTSTGEAARDAEARRDTKTQRDAEMLHDSGTSHDAEAPPADASPERFDASRDLIEQMLEAKSAPAAGEGGGRANESSGRGAVMRDELSGFESSDFTRFLREVVGPHVTADTDARAEELTRVVDEAVG